MNAAEVMSVLVGEHSVTILKSPLPDEWAFLFEVTDHGPNTDNHGTKL